MYVFAVPASRDLIIEQLMGQLMAEPHISMRDDFEMTTPEIDLLMDIAKAEIGEQGACV
jgi:galactokinase